MKKASVLHCFIKTFQILNQNHYIYGLYFLKTFLSKAGELLLQFGLRDNADFQGKVELDLGSQEDWCPAVLISVQTQDFSRSPKSKS